MTVIQYMPPPGLSQTAAMIFARHGRVLLDITELAEVLGVSTSTLYKRRGVYKTLPSVRTGGATENWHIQDVADWIDALRSPAKAVQPKKKGRPTKAEQIARRDGNAVFDI